MASSRHHSRAMVLLAILAAPGLGTPARALDFAAGAGTPDDPYLIYTPEQMNAIGADPNNRDKHFKLMADIDLGGCTAEDTPVIGSANAAFTGTFDGNAHIVSRFACRRAGADNLGLFGYVSDIEAEIRNLGLVDPNVRGGTGNQVGSLVGQLREGTVTGCYVQGGSVVGNQMVGGLVGHNLGIIANSYTTCRVVGISSVGGFVGADGPCGRTDEACSAGTILDCSAAGPVAGTDKVGGFMGTAQGEVRSCFWDIQTSGQATSAAGTGKSTAEMRDPGTFVAAGWDFFGLADGPSEVWTTDPGTRHPILWWQAPKTQWPGLPTFSGGTGTPDDPYLISSAEDLNSIGHNPRLMGSCFRLTDDIDLSQFNSYPIGSREAPFAGVFDGSNRTLVRFTCAYTEAYSIGVFGCVQGRNALVRDLGLTDPYVENNGKGGGAGALIGYLRRGTVNNCFVERGRVSGYLDTGGLVGYARFGDIRDCRSTAAVTSCMRAGGLVGRNGAATVTRCYATGTVQSNGEVGGLLGINFSDAITDCHATGMVTGGNFVGGLVGFNGGTLRNCYATSRVTACFSGRQMVGGLVGGNEGSLTACHATGDVTGTSYVGGLAGDHHVGVITDCYAAGSVQSDSQTGGLIGFSTGLVASCYATGTVIGDEEIGGLVGLIINGHCADCYAAGAVTGGEDVGGLVGLLNGELSHCYAVARVEGAEGAGGLCGAGGGEKVTACFWNIETSGQSHSFGGEGKTTAQLHDPNTFFDVGWDFVGETANGTDDIWTICEGRDYPRLRWEGVECE